MAPTTLPADPAQAAADLVASQGDEWLSTFVEALEERRSGRELERLRDRWGLTRVELARCFGVSRQALTKWEAAGVPPERAPEVAELAAATDVLVRHLRDDRIRAVVRRRAPGLGDRSLVEIATSGDTAGVLDAVRRMFAFGDAHV